MRWALIENGKVANVVEQDTQPQIAGTWIACGDAGPGWDFTDGVFTNPAVVLSLVPASVTMRQGREMLIEMGLLANVNAIIAAIPDAMQRAKAENYFNMSNTMERQNAWVKSIGAALGLSETQLDDMFIEAAKR